MAVTVVDAVIVNGVVEIFFTTNAASGAAVAPLSAYEAGDVQLYKGHSATQRSSTSGWTMTSPFDSITGLHQLSIDLSDNTDAGFYATQNVYTAVLSADTETVDGQVVVAVLAQFRIGPTQVDVISWDGTAAPTPATAGIPDVNVKNMNNVAATSITAINANQGTTQPVNFTGTAGAALVKGDAVDWAGGAIPAPAVTGVPKIDLAYILGTVLTETAGLIAAAFSKFFNKATPTGTVNSIPDAVAGAAGGLLIAGTNAPVTITGSGDALTLTSTGANGAGLKATGQGSGNGMSLVAGASGKTNTPVVTSYTIVKNTAFNNFEFEMVLSSDHVSPAPGKTVTVQRSIDGGAYADCTNTPATSISDGTYKINLSAADLNGNMITLKMTATDCDTTKIGIVTQS